MLRKELKIENESLRILLLKGINSHLVKRRFDEIQSRKLTNARTSKCKLSSFKDDQSQIENDI